MRVLKALLVFTLLIQLGVLAQSSSAGGCGVYPQWHNGAYYATRWVFPWFAAQGDPNAEDIATSPGWKSWISATNLSSKEGVSIDVGFLRPEGGGYAQAVWITTRGSEPRRLMGTQFGMHPGETVEFRVLAKANSEAGDGYPMPGLVFGSVQVTFTSMDPCDLDVQGKLALTFLNIKIDGSVTRLGTVDAVRVDTATNRVLANITATPAWARNGNPAVELPSFALMNLSALRQDIKVSLLGSDGSPAIAPKTVTLEAGAVMGIEVENFFGIDAFNTTSKTFTGRVVFEGSAPLAAIALQFVGNEAMGSKKVWSF